MKLMLRLPSKKGVGRGAAGVTIKFLVQFTFSRGRGGGDRVKIAALAYLHPPEKARARVAGW